VFVLRGRPSSEEASGVEREPSRKILHRASERHLITAEEASSKCPRSSTEATGEWRNGRLGSSIPPGLNKDVERGMFVGSSADCCATLTAFKPSTTSLNKEGGRALASGRELNAGRRTYLALSWSEDRGGFRYKSEEGNAKRGPDVEKSTLRGGSKDLT